MIGHLQELKGKSKTSIDTVGTSRGEAIYSCPKNAHKYYLTLNMCVCQHVHTHIGTVVCTCEARHLRACVS